MKERGKVQGEPHLRYKQQNLIEHTRQKETVFNLSPLTSYYTTGQRSCKSLTQEKSRKLNSENEGEFFKQVSSPQCGWTRPFESSFIRFIRKHWRLRFLNTATVLILVCCNGEMVKVPKGKQASTISYWCKVRVALLWWEAEEQRGGGRFSGSPDPGVSSINARQCNHQHGGMSQLRETFRSHVLNTGVGSKSIPTQLIGLISDWPAENARHGNAPVLHHEILWYFGVLIVSFSPTINTKTEPAS